MKKTVAIAIAIFVVFVSGVLVFGFVLKQQKESEVSNTETTNSSNPPDQSQSTTANTTPSASANTYSAAQVAAHNKASDCWLIISGKVYNITNFLDQHPGGTDVILPYCGKDATRAFDTQGGRRSGHSNSARQQLAEFQVGSL